MPRGNGTGPMGTGPATGRGMGYCAGYPVPGCANPGFGFRMGQEKGFGRMHYMTGLPGRAHAGYAPYTAGYPVYAGTQTPPENEKQILENQAAYLEDQLKKVREQLDKTEKND